VIAAAAAWKATRAFLSRVPWQVYAALALLVVILLARWHWIGVGEDRATAACHAAQEAAQAAYEAEALRRERAATDAALSAAYAAQKAVTETRVETDERAERVRVEWRERIVEVPADCRDALRQPERMRDAGREAVAAARGAL
jgi:hypothetical protein